MAYRIITNLPTVGADNDSWGTELNDAITELDTGAAKASDVYTKVQADAKYVQTVNGVAPDALGDVAVATGGGGGTGGVPDDGSVTDAKIVSGGLSPNSITGVAVVNSDARLSDQRTPKSHAATHSSGGTDAISPANIGAVGRSNDSITLPNSTTSWLTVTIPNDGSSTSTWPDRLKFSWKGHNTGYFNEYGEVRAVQADSTVAMRAMSNPTPNNTDIFQVAPYGGSGAAYLGVSKNAITASVPMTSTSTISATNIGPKVVVSTTAPSDTSLVWLDISGL